MSKYRRGSEFIHNIVSVPYPSVSRWNFYHGHFARGVPYFSPEILGFFTKKVKSSNRTVFKIKTVLAFGLVYFKDADRSAIILKQINSKISVSANRTGVKI